MPRVLAAFLLAVCAGAWQPPPPPTAKPPFTPPTHHLKLHGWHLELHENQAIRSPYYSQCKFYRGRVLNEPGSSATVTECEGLLYGLLQIGKEEFVLQPTESVSHVVRRRDVLLAEQPAYNLTGDTLDDLDIHLEEDAARPRMRPRHSHDDAHDTDYFRGVMPVTRPVAGPQGLWLEMAIIADHTMLKFHGRDRVKHYILALMNIVSAIFNDPSLGSNMTLVINKLYLYEEKDPVVRYGNVKKSLEAANKWNYRHLMKLPSGSTAWDAAIWLTRSELGGPSGFAPVGGVCSKTRSAAIDRDEGLTSAFVIAHELAHLLGLTHDGEDQCPAEAKAGSVMAPTVLATLHNFAWSKCSKEQFHQKSKKWWCLHQRSGEEGVELGGAKELSNYVFTMDEQCRTEFGEGFSVCKSVKVRSACSRLWCAHRAMPLVCRSKRAPPLEGTPCGLHKWCVDRVCEPMPGHGEEENQVEEESPAPPTWDSWGPWSDCSADCGYGVRTRHRHCRRQGVISETACAGAGSQAAPCWAGVCAAVRDARADFCARRGRRYIPYVNETNQCEGWCVEYSGGEPSPHGLLPDGTSCSYHRPFDVCYQGACMQGQCNGSDPVCNWCPDGYCNNNTHFYTRYLGKGWTRITVIPHEAHQLSVHISTPIPLHIAVRERKRERPILELTNHGKQIELEQNNYLKYDPTVPQNLQIIEMDSNVIDIKENRFGSEGAVVTAGTLLKFKQTDTDVYITADSRFNTDLMIMAIPEQPLMADDAIPVEVSVNYSTPTGHRRPLEYRWSTERGPCSASCGGGVRVVVTKCPRDQRCAPLQYEACNTHSCTFEWQPGEWEECSATCGSSGVQERQLFCTPTNASTSSRSDLIRHSVSPALCPAEKPPREQPCNVIPCPVYWREMPWTPCSKTCGRGVSYRPWYCPASDEMLCGPKPRERRRRCRLRRCPPSDRPPLTCPETDATQYCDLFTIEQLQRNCVVPPFRKYCCNACQHADSVERRGAG